MIKCCIFDLDGTLLDTLTTITYYVNKTLQKHGISEISKEECRTFIGNGARLLLTRAQKARGVENEELLPTLLSEYNEAYNKDASYLTAPYPMIPELLSELKSQNVKLAVFSNKPEPTVRFTVNHFFPGVFDVVVGGREDCPLKPDATLGREILATLSVLPEEVAFIGDTPVDIETAKNLNAKLKVGVLWGFRSREELVAAGANLLVSDAREILEEVLALD